MSLIEVESRYVQTKLTSEEFIIVKKAVLDTNSTLNDFIKAAIFEKILVAQSERVEEVKEIVL